MIALRPFSQLSTHDTPSMEVEDKSCDGAVTSAAAAAVNQDQIQATKKGDDDFDSIPVVNLSLSLNVYASQIDDACRSSGFFYVIHHGVDRALMQRVMENSRSFFRLDLMHKSAVGTRQPSSSSSDGGGYRGYFGMGMEDLDNKDGTRDLAMEEGNCGISDEMEAEGTNNGGGDQKEGFDCGLEGVSGYHLNTLSRNAYIDFFGDNSWPDEDDHESIVGFRKTLIEYQQALLQLSDKLLIALAVSLSLRINKNIPMNYFIDRSRNPMCTLRLLHYPPVTPNTHSRASHGCGAHTDYGLFTILQQDEIGGLQIRNRSNRWIDARPIPGSFVINVGDMLSWWTEGMYASTVHRVISPAWRDDSLTSSDDKDRDDGYEYGAPHRYSIPFFFNPDHDAVVKPIRYVGAADEDDCGKTAIEILKERYAGTFKSN